MDTYGDRVGEMVSGIVKRTERNGIIIDLGKMPRLSFLERSNSS